MNQRIVGRSDPLRVAVEAYIRRVFARQHSATLRELPDRLVATFGPDLMPLCAAGLRTADDGFFSEYYLRASVESVLRRVCGVPVDRREIIEVTSLASDRPGHAFGLLDYITQLGRKEGRSWGVFTATDKLRRCLGRTGLVITTLAVAEAEAVPNREDWGRYYDARPVVCAMHDRGEQPLAFRPLPVRPTVSGSGRPMEDERLG